ncbi:hypothetical protein JYQ62_22770 [Nostoc sp. UHCC 0702]|nr:hypothetical protein JYQ62_22770 [Nostoc sp. UHCC 0702]
MKIKRLPTIYILGLGKNWRRDVEIMQRQTNRLFDQMLLPQQSDRLRGDVVHRADSIVFTPAAEIHETIDAFKLRIELPGLEADDLDVISSSANYLRSSRFAW